MASEEYKHVMTGVWAAKDGKPACKSTLAMEHMVAAHTSEKAMKAEKKKAAASAVSTSASSSSKAKRARKAT